MKGKPALWLEPEPSEPECGTANGYNRGCRCEDCRYAHARSNRQSRNIAQIRKRIRLPLGEWIQQGRCRTIPAAHRLWFFSDNVGESAMAREICRTCPVRVQCLNYAIDARERYVWGGESARGRERIRRERERDRKR